jgi:NADH dehydrogenase FAD-containing subunit
MNDIVASVDAPQRGDADVTLIDRRNHYIFQPLLYPVRRPCWHRPRFPLRSPSARLKRSAIGFSTHLAIYIATSFAK